MSYITIYCNEQMLLDNWRYYDESNQKLRNTLIKTNLSNEQCAEFYFDHMHNREAVKYSFDDLVARFRKERSRKGKLLTVTTIPIYQGDIDYIVQANHDYRLSIPEMRILFGVIFLCRLYESNIARLDTKFKMKGFTRLYDEGLQYAYIVDGVYWYEVYNTINGLQRLSDELHILRKISTNNIGCRYEYPNYEAALESEVVYTYNVTVENNRLRLSDLFKELVPYNEKYCLICGQKIAICKQKIVASGNPTKYCAECAQSKEQYRLVLKGNHIIRKLPIIN